MKFHDPKFTRLLLCFSIVVIAIITGTAWSMDNKADRPSTDKQHVVVHLSHFTDDLHRCFMAFKLAGLMKKAGAEVTIFLDLEGVRVAERRQQLDMTWGSSSTTLTELYQRFTEAGGKVILCPHCAKSARIGDMGLKRYAQIGTENSLGTMLIEADKILDY